MPGGLMELLTIAVPMVISQSCETLMMFTDRMFLARLGPEYMSASMGGGLTSFMFITFLMGLTGFANALVAQYLGARQERRCAVVVSQAMLISLAAYPLILLCIPLGIWMFRVSGIAPEQLPLQISFFKIVMFGAIIALLRNCLSSFFSGIGQARTVMVSAGVALVVNAAVSYVLIFGRFGLPMLGIDGAALGTLTGATAGLGVLLIGYLRPAIRRRFAVLAAFRFDRETMMMLVRMGTPSGLEFFLNLLAFNMIVLSFHSYGLVAATSMTIMLNWDMVSFIPLIGVGIAVSSLVGRYMGAGSPDTAHRATMSGMKLAGLYTTVTFTMFAIFPRSMVAAFLPADAPHAAAISVLAVFMVRLIVVYLFADATMIVFSSALRGAGDTFWTMVISVSGHWTLALTAIVMVRLVHTSPRATWSMVVAMILCLATMFVLRYRSGRWRKLRIVHQEPAAPIAAAECGEAETAAR